MRTTKTNQHETVTIHGIKYLFKHQTVCQAQGCKGDWMLYAYHLGSYKYVCKFSSREETIEYLTYLKEDKSHSKEEAI